MNPTQSASQDNPDSLEKMPEVTGLQSHLDAMHQSNANEVASSRATEQASSVQAAQAAADAAHTAAAPVPDTPPPITGTPVAVLPTNNNPPVADDNDLIEQEWITKAKSIVEATKDDPYMQNKEIGEFKADYIKKRYKKDIKVSEA